jgi:hypothetical protein
MSKKLGLDAAYKGLNLTKQCTIKISILVKINLSGSTGMKVLMINKNGYKFNSTKTT